MSGLRRQNHWLDPAGLFAPREYRGGIVQTPDGPRVQLYDSSGKPKGLGYLSATADADLNPAAVLEAHSNRKQQDALDKLERRDTARYQDQAGRADRQLEATITQGNNQLTLGLAGINQAITADRNRHEVLIEQLRQQGEQNKDANQLAYATLNRQDATANRALDLKGLEMQANIQLRKDEIEQMRGARKLAFIGQAMQALMA